MRTLILGAALAALVVVAPVGAEDHICVKDGIQTAALTRSSCVKGGGSWKTAPKPPKAPKAQKPTPKKGAK
jgi:hypothetical protein